jgi:hypothetical protein
VRLLAVCFASADSPQGPLKRALHTSFLRPPGCADGADYLRSLPRASSSLPWLCFFSRSSRSLELWVRFLLEDGAIDLEDASYRGYVHRGHINGFFDQERAAGEHVLARNLMPVLVLRVVEFSEEGSAQRHMSVVNFTEPVEGHSPSLFTLSSKGCFPTCSEGDKARVRRGTACRAPTVALRYQRGRIPGQAIEDRLGWAVGWMC